MKVGKMNVVFEENSNMGFLLKRLSELKTQLYFNDLEFFTYKLSQDGVNSQCEIIE